MLDDEDTFLPHGPAAAAAAHYDVSVERMQEIIDASQVELEAIFSRININLLNEDLLREAAIQMDKFMLRKYGLKRRMPNG